MAHVPRTKKAEDTSVGEESRFSLPNDQISDCEWCRKHGSCIGIACTRRTLFER